MAQLQERRFILKGHTPTTNANGLVSIEIEEGTVVTGIFSAID